MDFESAWKKNFKWKSQNMPQKIIDTVSLDMCMGHHLSGHVPVDILGSSEILTEH